MWVRGTQLPPEEATVTTAVGTTTAPLHRHSTETQMPVATIKKPEMVIVSGPCWDYYKQSEFCYGPESKSVCELDPEYKFGQCPIEYICEKFGVDLEPSQDGVVAERSEIKDEDGGEIITVRQIYDVDAWVRESKDLGTLAYRMSCADEAGVQYAIASIPVFGGEPPSGCKEGVFSWDEDAFLMPIGHREVENGKARTWDLYPRFGDEDEVST